MLERSYGVEDLSIAGDGRTLTLACVPFDVPSVVDDGRGPYREQFRRGAFARVVKAPNRIELRYYHERGSSLPFGFGQAMREDPKYLVGDFRVAKGVQGDQLLSLVEDGLRGVSIGFVEDPDGNIREGDLVTRTNVKRLVEVSLTPSPAHPLAEVVAVRSGEPALLAAAVERERLWLLSQGRTC